jgi:uncharacterized lipoprotein YajG
MRKILGILALSLTLAACNIHNPATTVRTLDERPSLSLSGAPAEAVLFVDGLDMGPAKAYDGRPQVLRLEPGTHLIEVKSAGVTIFKQTVFIESGLKEIKVH